MILNCIFSFINQLPVTIVFHLFVSISGDINTFRGLFQPALSKLLFKIISRQLSLKWLHCLTPIGTEVIPLGVFHNRSIDQLVSSLKALGIPVSSGNLPVHSYYFRIVFIFRKGKVGLFSQFTDTCLFTERIHFLQVLPLSHGLGSGLGDKNGLGLFEKVFSLGVIEYFCYLGKIGAATVTSVSLPSL